MYKAVIAGGGSGGMAVASQLIRAGVAKPTEIAVIEPSKYHYYQPGFTSLGGGLQGTSSQVLSTGLSGLRRDTSSVFDSRIRVYPEKVTGFSPDRNSISTETRELSYEFLIVSLGLQLNFAQVPGLTEALEDNDCPVASIYSFDHALKTNNFIRGFRGGDALFCQPNQPFKCGGAPQKLMYLAESSWRASGVRSRTSMHFYLPQQVMFGVKKYSDALTQIALNKGCELHYQHLLSKVDKDRKIAVFNDNEGNSVEMGFEFLHVCPPQGALDVLKNSPLVDAAGFVDVDKHTMRHKKYENVWALGDASSLPTSKTAAAVFVEAPILVENIKRTYAGNTMAGYHGYTCCPLFVGGNKVMMAEFKYEGVPDESFTSTQERPNSLFYYLTLHGFQRIYFGLVPRGLWYGRTGLFKPKYS